MKGRRLLKNGHGCERGRESEKVRVPGDPDGTRARPTMMVSPIGERSHPPEAYAPLMMGCALYKGAHTHAPPTST
jgi:hypothetical protein